MEQCKGCGIATKGEHPYVGIARADDSDPASDMVQYPVCEACWLDPEHRTLSALKCHFHPRADAAEGLTASQRLLKRSREAKHQDIG